jgi:hypothetical protein
MLRVHQSQARLLTNAERFWTDRIAQRDTYAHALVVSISRPLIRRRGISMPSQEFHLEATPSNKNELDLLCAALQCDTEASDAAGRRLVRLRMEGEQLPIVYHVNHLLRAQDENT